MSSTPTASRINGFPRQKTPSTDWEARLDYLMDAQSKTLDFNERKKDYDEVQEILCEQVPMIFTVTPFFYAAARSDIGNLRPDAVERLPRDVERRGALFQKITWRLSAEGRSIRFLEMQHSAERR